MTAMPSSAPWYTFQGYGPRELKFLADVLDGHSRQILVLMDIAPGSSWLEVGTGIGSMANRLAERVGPAGRGLSIELYPGPDRAANDVTWLHGGHASDPCAEGPFDLIHAPLVLLHLPEREQLVHELAGALDIGGSLVISEWELRGVALICEPDDPAVHRLFEVFDEAMRVILSADGADPTWPQRAHTVMEDAGLIVRIRVAGGDRSRGGSAFCQLLLSHTYRLQARLLDAGMSAGELAALRAILMDPKLLVCPYPLTSVVAQRVT